MKSAGKDEMIPGILGGMGPEATIDLMQRILAKTPALDDIDHIRCIVDNNPKIPSRMRALLDQDGEDPGPCLAEMARGLERWGADFLVIPCNTAHAYYAAVAEAVDIPVVHLIDLVVERVAGQTEPSDRIGILGSNTILKTELYTRKFALRQRQVIYPEEELQERLFQIIRRVKRGETGPPIRLELREIAKHLQERGAVLAVLGCTELGIIAEDLPLPAVDAAEVLAEEVVAVAKNKKLPHIESLNLDKDGPRE